MANHDNQAQNLSAMSDEEARLAELAKLLKMYRSKMEDFLELEQEILRAAHTMSKDEDLEQTRKKLEALM